MISRHKNTKLDDRCCMKYWMIYGLYICVIQSFFIEAFAWPSRLHFPGGKEDDITVVAATWCSVWHGVGGIAAYHLFCEFVNSYYVFFVGSLTAALPSQT